MESPDFTVSKTTSSLPQPPAMEVRNADAEHLKALTVAHFVAAGLAFLGAFAILGSFSMSAAKAASFHGAVGEMENLFHPTGMKLMFLCVGAVFLIAGVLNLLSARAIKARKQRTFSLVVAAIDCLQMPLGTILGVFTIVVLMRNSVRKLYGVEQVGAVNKPTESPKARPRAKSIGLRTSDFE